MIDPLEHVTYQIYNAPMRQYPFPHFYATNVFPDDFYTQLLASLPDESAYTLKTGKFKGRQFADPNANPLLAFMRTPEFLQRIARVFTPWLQKMYPDGSLEVFDDLRLVRDSNGYAIGPHTDAPWKLVSLLFYLPEDDSLKSLGTSIYTPKDPAFRCFGGPHHPVNQFNRAFTAPFMPNSCLGFLKTNQSFHGVEQVTIPCTRNVLLYNLYKKGAGNKPE